MQGIIAAVGLGALIVASQPVFTVIKWAGIAYLIFLGLQALRSAWRGQYATPTATRSTSSTRQPAWAGWRQGFLSNITNPKVLVFYLAVLPQFLAPDAATWQIAALALTHAVLSLGYLLLGRRAPPYPATVRHEGRFVGPSTPRPQRPFSDSVDCWFATS